MAKTSPNAAQRQGVAWAHAGAVVAFGFAALLCPTFAPAVSVYGDMAAAAENDSGLQGNFDNQVKQGSFKGSAWAALTGKDRDEIAK